MPPGRVPFRVLLGGYITWEVFGFYFFFAGMYASASGAWNALRPFKMEEASSLPADSRITEPHLLEELLDVLLHVNSPFICVRSLFQLSEADATVYHPYKLEYHPALGIDACFIMLVC